MGGNLTSTTRETVPAVSDEIESARPVCKDVGVLWIARSKSGVHATESCRGLRTVAHVFSSIMGSRVATHVTIPGLPFLISKPLFE